ncbi:transcriptional regulator GcvA [Lentibacter algarum]|uniref:transcriptional regulator GcvA n=1 Tax=Lentibacter algarum TaxID=576131 RepID=UPI001C09ECE3|nr:transcriptional regulator GcvA [Lentibacter algarum]MBU2983588.1 transcriptional regulator GcvA [Lentibacter algarum]
MPSRLPPLTALRAFEAAARLLSFSGAANELGVTPAALSFQIKSLEEHFEAPLFYRHNRAVTLTEGGAALLPGLADGFASFERAWQRALQSKDTNVLTVSTGPAFMSKWMAPRIFNFTQNNNDVELRFSASLRLLDFDRDGIDVAVRFGYGSDAGLHSFTLGEEWVTPAMTPEMAEKFTTVESLTKAPLLIDDSIDFLKPRCDWPAWFQAAGTTENNVRGAHFSNADHAIGAALSGAGVVLGRASLIARDVAERRLVAPFSVGLVTQGRWRFLCLEGQETRPAIAAFKSWLIDEAKTVDFLREGREFVSVEALSKP